MPKLFEQRDANMLSLKGNLIILCGHYKGVDQRVRDHFDYHGVFSIGDYVLTGGELAAAIVSDAIVPSYPRSFIRRNICPHRFFPGTGLLSPPVYTRPAEYKGLACS